MWEEVISNKETHEDPIIHTPLKVKGERQAGHGELSGKVLKTWVIWNALNHWIQLFQ